MNTDKSYVEAFRETISNKEFRNAEFDIYNENLFIEAVKLGYLDAARTFKGIKDKGEVFKELAKEIQNYFTSDNMNFENAHKKFCNIFIDGLYKNEYEAKYGQAQKVVNMAFKYLYCCKGAEEYKGKFANCHMALDSYTLNWFKYDVLKDWYNKQTDKTKYPIIRYGKINSNCTWSNLPYGIKNDKRDSDEEENKYEPYSYLWIQKIIKEYFESNSSHPYKTKNGESLSPFEAEFYIWPEQQWKEAFKNLTKLKGSTLALSRALSSLSQQEDNDIREITEAINMHTRSGTHCTNKN